MSMVNVYKSIGPPEIPVNFTVKGIPAHNGTGSQLFLRWTTPQTPEKRKNNKPPDEFVVSYQVKDPDQERKERVVKGVEEVTLSDLSPCTTFNIMVVACNTAACSLPSHSVTYTTLPSHSPSKTLYYLLIAIYVQHLCLYSMAERYAVQR